MTIYSLDVLLSLFGTSLLFHVQFLTCIQISQEAGQVVWYSHLFKNFPEFVVDHTVKGFGIVNKAEVDIFLELSCFFDCFSSIFIILFIFLFNFYSLLIAIFCNPWALQGRLPVFLLQMLLYVLAPSSCLLGAVFENFLRRCVSWAWSLKMSTE